LEKRSGVLAFLDDLAAFPTAFPVRIFRCGGLNRGNAMRPGESTMIMPWTWLPQENKSGTLRYMDRLHGALAPGLQQGRQCDTPATEGAEEGGGDTGINTAAPVVCSQY
jgi:hypothetical protein